MHEHSTPKYIFKINDIPLIISGIKLPRVHYVVKAGYLQPFLPSLGRGSSIIYSLTDIYLLAVLNQLLEYGIDLRNAQIIIKKTTVFIAKLSVAKTDDILVLNGNEMAFAKQKDLKISFDAKHYRPQVVVAVGLIKRDVDTRIAELMLKREAKLKIKTRQIEKAKKLTDNTSLR